MQQAASTAKDGGETSPSGQEPDVQLTAMVPRRIRHAVQMHAVQRGMTVRTLILSLLKEAGIASVDDDELIDRRSRAAASRKAAP